MNKEKEEIKIKGKKYLKYYEAISDCMCIENPRNKKTFAINRIVLTGGNVTTFKECKCCGEMVASGEEYVQPIDKKLLKQMLEIGAKQIK